MKLGRRLTALSKTALKGGKLAAVAAVSGAMLMAAGTGTAEAQKKVRWQVPIGFPSKLPGIGTPALYLAEQVNAMSGGNMQFRIEEPGKVVPAFEILNAVSSGKVPAGFTWVGYDAGKIPALPLYSGAPFNMEPPAYTAWWYFGDGAKMLQEIYAKQNVHPVLCSIVGPETAGWYRQPIDGLDDYKGLKIRFAGLGGQVLQKLGASVTMLPGGELFQALEKGTIDATEFSLPSIDQVLGFHKVVKYNIFPGWHQTFTTMHFLVNKKEWDGLDKSQQAMINNACQAATLYGFSEGEWQQPQVISTFGEKGVTAKSLPMPVLRKLQEVSNEVYAEQSKADADFKRVYESQKAFMDKYQAWKELGYLPRDFK